jgi:hypothetical protein
MITVEKIEKDNGRTYKIQYHIPLKLSLKHFSDRIDLESEYEANQYGLEKIMDAPESLCSLYALYKKLDSEKRFGIYIEPYDRKEIKFIEP